MAKGDIISRLKLESGEFDAKIKRAGQELLNYAEHCRKMSQSMGYANRDAREFAKSLGSMQTVSQTARGKINELSEAFVNAKVMYKNMTDEEKRSPFGRNLSASLDQLKVRLNSAKRDLSDVQAELNASKFGQFGNVVDTIGNRLGVAGSLTEMLTSKTALLTGALGAGIAVIGKATEAWASYNSELAKQDEITIVTTGLKGDEAKRMTDTMRALSDTYKVDFREAVNAANTLMSQFGVSGDEAIRLIRDGMQGMIRGDGPKLLSMIQQFAPAFQSAGVSASQLVAVIHNSEGGIFTDQNMQAIVMGIKNIRLMTKATSEALAKMGIDGQEMTRKMSNGTMTVFDALKLVVGQLKNVDSNSQAAGEVMQQVFGRQGAMAGTNLAKAIEGLNTNLEETKKQTGEVGEAFSELQTANERLNTAIREAFSYDGWDQMATGIKSKLITALSVVIEKLAVIKDLYGSITPNGPRQPQNNGGIGYSDVQGAINYIQRGTNQAERERRYDQQIAALNSKLQQIGKERQVRNDDGTTSYVIDSLEKQQQKREALERRVRLLENKRESLIQGHNQETVKTNTVNTTTSTTNGSTSTTSIEDKMAQMWERTFMRSVATSDTFVNPNEYEGSEVWKAISQETETAIGPLQKMREELAYLTKSLDEAANPEAYQDIKKVIEGKQRQIADFTGETKPQKTEDKTSTELSKISGNMSKVTGGIGNIFNGLQQMGIEIPKEINNVIGVVNGISTILMGISALLTLINGKQDVQIFTNIIPFAHGGVVPHAAMGYYVPGTHRSGDVTPIMANAGELVLNESSQGTLAADLLQARGLLESIERFSPMLSMAAQTAVGSQMQGGVETLKLEAYVQGEQLHLVHNRFLKRSGQGELATWK